MAQTKIKAGLFEGIIGNGTDGYFLMSNGDGTMTWSSIIVNPTITSIAYPGSVTAADPAGGETITVTGTGFKTGATVTVGGTAAPAVSYVSATQITFTTPAKAAGDYDIVVTNTDTGSATYINGISYNGIPSWTTAAGSLGTFASGATISTITLQASEPDAGTITFNITNGALPTGLSLTGANIDGTTSLLTADTLYTFTVTATDDESQATPRTFTITVQKQLISTENFTINTYTGNGSTQTIGGKIGTAVEFNGSSSQIDISNSLGMGVNDFAYSFWFKSNAPTANEQAFMQVLDQHVNYGVKINSTYKLTSAPTNSSGGIQYIGTNNITLDTDWHHVAYTKSSTAGHSLWYDGTKVAEDTSFTGDVQATTGIITLGSATNDIAWFNGYLDQVRFFNKALSSSEISTLAAESNTSSTKSTTDIFADGSGVALYEFEKGAIDTGGTSGYIGNGGIFNGSNSKIELPNNAYKYTTFTVSLFAHSSDWTQSLATLYSFYDNDGTNGGGFIGINNDVVCFFGAGGASSPTTTNGTTTLTDNTWYHILLKVDGTSVKVYLDGTEEISVTLGSNFSYRPTHQFTIGARDIGANTYGYFNGKIDQVRIFNTAVSDANRTTLGAETSASATRSTTDIFNDSSGVALYELEGNANDTGGTYNGTATNVSYAYDGTPANVSFVGTSFQPDLVWIKCRNNGYSHHIQDVIRGAGALKDISSDGTWAEGTYNYGSINSFDTNGITVGSGGHSTYGRAQTNESGKTYVAWMWKAGGTAVSNTNGTITSTVSANQYAGFSIVKYTGGGTGTQTVGHGLSASPELVIIKNLTDAEGWIIWHKDFTTSEYLQFTGTGKQSFSNIWGGTPSSSVIYVGSDRWGTMSGSSKNYISYNFHSVDGYQKIGSYSGGSTSTIVTGFQPRFLMVKRTDSAAGWYMFDSARNPSNPKSLVLFANTSAAEGVEGSFYQPSFVTNGFSWPYADGAGVNISGGTYIYLAIA